MKVIIGTDPFGFDLKEGVRKALIAESYEVHDVSPEAIEFYDAAKLVAQGVQSGEYQRGIVLCGTGMGVSIIANKFKGVYAALCENWYQARRARSVNNTNVLCMGGMITGVELGVQIALIWLKTEHCEGFSSEDAKLFARDFQALLDVENEVY